MDEQKKMYPVQIGHPQNDQMAAGLNEDLNKLLESIRSYRAEHGEALRGDESALMGVVSVSLHDRGYSRMHLASMLAAALLRMSRD